MLLEKKTFLTFNFVFQLKENEERFLFYELDSSLVVISCNFSSNQTFVTEVYIDIYFSVIQVLWINIFEMYTLYISKRK